MAKVTAQTIINKAKEYEGVKESPANSNNVIFNTHYYGQAVSGSSYPWCCAYIWDIFRICNASELFCGGQKTAYCPFVETYYRNQGRWHSEGICGDLALFDFSNSGIAGHIGIVIKKNSDGTYQTIEGNTGTGNDANGGAVMIRTRSKSVIRGFARPDYATSSSVYVATSTDTVMGMKLTDIAKYINAEFGIASGQNYNCLLGVAQCMKDMAEVGGYGNTLSAVLKNNFTSPSSTYTAECLQAVKDVFVNGKQRFDNARILQFRSFSKYSDGNGNPDKNKCASVLAKYDYLGSDYLTLSLGHLYFGKWLNGQNTESQAGSTATSSTVLKIGSAGAAVKTLQTNLNKLGYGLVVDGDFGSKTDAAVRKFQSKYGLVVDGEYGPISKTKLESVCAERDKQTSTSTTANNKTYGVADKVDDSLSGTYKTTADLNLRYKAGVLTADNVIAVIPEGGKVQCYKYYTDVDGKKWLYVSYGSKVGFVSSQYLKKQ